MENQTKRASIRKLSEEDYNPFFQFFLDCLFSEPVPLLIESTPLSEWYQKLDLLVKSPFDIDDSFKELDKLKGKNPEDGTYMIHFENTNHDDMYFFRVDFPKEFAIKLSPRVYVFNSDKPEEFIREYMLVFNTMII